PPYWTVLERAAPRHVGCSCAELERTRLGAQAIAKSSSCIKNFRLGGRKKKHWIDQVDFGASGLEASAGLGFAPTRERRLPCTSQKVAHLGRLQHRSDSE